MLGEGVPLVLAGDEVGNSQSDNNAYCQDNAVGWVDWSGLGREGEDMRFALLARTPDSCLHTPCDALTNDSTERCVAFLSSRRRR